MRAQVVAAPVSRFAATYSDSDDDSDDGNRVARSAKDRTWDAMARIVNAVANALKISDWGAVVDGACPLPRP